MNPDYLSFYRTVIEHAADAARDHLPWRTKITPYRVLVSEMMLQQTQVDRVIPFFYRWMKDFPSWKSLAEASQREVLKHWKGLGYNSRALRLHALAKIVVEQYGGRLPKNTKELESLPGIGPYTAGAICAFAFNIYTPFIETNIRRVFIHHFFQGKSNISDTDIFKVMDDMGAIEDPRTWYTALMDYGSQLPKIAGHNPNQKSRGYTKQSRFKGSDREVRGKILELLLEKKNHRLRYQDLLKILGIQQERCGNILSQLEKESFLVHKGEYIILQ